jgi:hypothetical protein
MVGCLDKHLRQGVFYIFLGNHPFCLSTSAFLTAGGQTILHLFQMPSTQGEPEQDLSTRSHGNTGDQANENLEANAIKGLWRALLRHATTQKNGQGPGKPARVV